jgi:hypothetical protein
MYILYMYIYVYMYVGSLLYWLSASINIFQEKYSGIYTYIYLYIYIYTYTYLYIYICMYKYICMYIYIYIYIFRGHRFYPYYKEYRIICFIFRDIFCHWMDDTGTYSLLLFAFRYMYMYILL